MNSKKIIALSAIILGGVLSSSAFATTATAHANVAKLAKFEAPVLEKMVSPTNLSRRHGPNVTVTFTVDETGRTHDVRIISRGDEALAPSLVPAVSRWEFKPATKNGVPVSTKIVLPIELVDSLRS